MKSPGKQKNRTEMRSRPPASPHAQALYQMEVADKGLDNILAEFETHWIGQEIEGDAYKPAEIPFFRSIVSACSTIRARSIAGSMRRAGKRAGRSGASRL